MRGIEGHEAVFREVAEVAFALMLAADGGLVPKGKILVLGTVGVEVAFDRGGHTNWTAAATRDVLRALEPRGGVSRYRDQRSRVADLLRVAAARIGYAAARNDPSLVRPGEAGVATEAVSRATTVGPSRLAKLRTTFAARAGGGVVTHDDSPVAAAPFRYRYVWWRPTSRGGVPTWAEGTAVLHEVAEEDAPVAARLRSHDDTVIDLRVHEGMCLRPVLSPGSWDPIDVRTFRAAALTGPAWADNPFAWCEEWLPLLSVDERAEPPNPRPSERQLLEASKASERCAAIAERLFVIDGVVHRTCHVPVATLARDVRGGPVRLAWEIPVGPSSGSVQDSLRTGRMAWRAMDAFWGIDPFVKGRSSPAHSHRPLADGTEVLDAYEEAVRRTFPRVGFERTLPFEVTRPDLLAPDTVGRLLDVVNWANLLFHGNTGREDVAEVARVAHEAAMGTGPVPPPGELPRLSDEPLATVGIVDDRTARDLLDRLEARLRAEVLASTDDLDEVATFSP